MKRTFRVQIYTCEYEKVIDFYKTINDVSNFSSA